MKIHRNLEPPGPARPRFESSEATLSRLQQPRGIFGLTGHKAAHGGQAQLHLSLSELLQFQGHGVLHGDLHLMKRTEKCLAALLKTRSKLTEEILHSAGLCHFTLLATRARMKEKMLSKMLSCPACAGTPAQASSPR